MQTWKETVTNKNAVDSRADSIARTMYNFIEGKKYLNKAGSNRNYTQELRETTGRRNGRGTQGEHRRELLQTQERGFTGLGNN